MTAVQDLDCEVVNPADRGAPTGGLASRVRRGAVWSAGGQVGSQLIQLASTAVLARLLSPTDFGLAGLVAVVTGILAIFMDCGIPTAIVRAPRLTEKFLATAFYVNLGLALLMSLLMCALAFPVARFFDEPALAGLMLLASLTFPLRINSIHVALMQRSMQFPRLTRMGMVTAATNTVVTIGCAAAGLGAASIIVGTLALGVVSMAQMQWAVRWWPRPRFSRDEARELWSFGRGILGSNLVTQIAFNSDRVLIGRALDVSAVGYWTRTVNLLMLPMRQSVGVLGGVFFSALSKMTDDLPRLRASWLVLLRATWILGLPVAGGMAACAPAFVGTIYGPQWDRIVPLMIITTAAVPLWMISAISRPVYEALGETSLCFKLTLVDSVVYIGFLALGLQWGLIGVAVATLARAPVTVVLMVVPLMHLLDMRILDVLLCAWRSALATAVMTPLVVAVPSLVPVDQVWLVLSCQVMTGACIYGALIWGLERQTLKRIVGRRKA